MAKEVKKDTEVKKAKSASVRRKKSQTVRERTQSSGKTTKRRQLKTKASAIKTPLNKASKTGKKEFHLPLPDNKAGRILGKRVRLIPGFIKNAWSEIKLVRWPNASETIRLTIAVFIFAVIFAIIVGLLDFGLNKLFKEVILNR